MCHATNSAFKGINVCAILRVHVLVRHRNTTDWLPLQQQARATATVTGMSDHTHAPTNAHGALATQGRDAAAATAPTYHSVQTHSATNVDLTATDSRQPPEAPRFKGWSTTSGMGTSSNTATGQPRRYGDLDTNSFATITTETPLDATNTGFQMLLKMGWKTGRGLGLRGQGRVDPVPVAQAYDRLGLGKMDADLDMAKETTESRRLLDSERLQQVDEATAEELEAKWRAAAEKKATIASDLKEVNSVFFCDVCRKQYKTPAEYDNHLSSYDHHHTKRLKDLRERDRKQKNLGGNKKKEQRKAAREMERISQLANLKADVKQAPVPAASVPAPQQPAQGPAAVHTTKAGWGHVDGGAPRSSLAARHTDTSGGWTGASSIEPTLSTTVSTTSTVSTVDSAKAAERRKRLEAWKAAQLPPQKIRDPVTHRSLTTRSVPNQKSSSDVNSNGTGGGWTATAPPRPPPPRPAGIVASHGLKASAVAKGGRSHAAFGESSDEDDEVSQPATTKKHGSLWKPS
eukprot:m.192574 g.192574  ORF g.192574 m.192574 type:complete len:516 (-) comp18678_c0_seq1:80-1627(-)